MVRSENVTFDRFPVFVWAKATRASRLERVLESVEEASARCAKRAM